MFTPAVLLLYMHEGSSGGSRVYKKEGAILDTVTILGVIACLSSGKLGGGGGGGLLPPGPSIRLWVLTQIQPGFISPLTQKIVTPFTRARVLTWIRLQFEHSQLTQIVTQDRSTLVESNQALIQGGWIGCLVTPLWKMSTGLIFFNQKSEIWYTISKFPCFIWVSMVLTSPSP